MAKWAVFDVDGTLLPHTSMEKMFMFHSMKTGILPAKNVLFYMLRMFLKLLHENFTEAFKNNKYYLRNLPVTQVGQTAEDFFKIRVQNKISDIGVKKIETFRKKDYRIMLMSGSPEFLIKPLEQYLCPDFAISTQLERKDGYFTGKVTGLHPYGERKTAILKEHAAKLNLTFGKSIAFANHHSDAHHMELFGEAVAVNPTPKLNEIAEAKNWKIEYWQ